MKLDRGMKAGDLPLAVFVLEEKARHHPKYFVLAKQKDIDCYLVRAVAICERALHPASGHASSALGKPTRSTKGAQVPLGRDP